MTTPPNSKPKQRVVQAINSTIKNLMEENSSLYFIGEDVLDPYGGAFKVSKGLSTAYPERVITTPISEAAMVGFATGLAMRGYPTIVEIMFGDFLTLTFDQLLNHASKLSWIYNNQVQIPLIIRAPMGGYRGYGSTHSQSIEKHFCGIPGLTVMTINQYQSPEKVYRDAFVLKAPVLIIENKVLYGKLIAEQTILPTFPDPDLILISYGGGLEHCFLAASELATQGFKIEVLPIEYLSPFPKKILMNASKRCDKFISVEEGCPGWGFAESCAAALINCNITKFASITGPDHPIPSDKQWETNILPSTDKIKALCLELLKE